MSRWKPARLTCVTCGQGVKMNDLGGWIHIRKTLLRDWHPVTL